MMRPIGLFASLISRRKNSTCHHHISPKRVHQRVFSEDAVQATSQSDSSNFKFSSLSNGPPVQFGTGKIAKLAESVVGSSGQTIVLATTASETRNPVDESSSSIIKFLRKKSSFLPLTVDYRQRHHAVGKIPSTANRSDNRRPTAAETLASRAIDRALRPLMKGNNNDSVHVSCSVQACPLDETGGNPVALALNSASASLRHRLKELVGCVYLNVLKDGTVLLDQAVPHEDSICDILYAGTRENIVMMEFSGMLTEAQIVDLIELAHGCIQPLLDTQEQLMQQVREVDSMDDAPLREQLGLPAEVQGESALQTNDDNEELAQLLFNQAFDYCKAQVGESSLRLFGVSDPKERIRKREDPSIYSNDEPPLVSKKIRGRKEQLLREEIQRLLIKFKPISSLEGEYSTVLESSDALCTLGDLIHSKMLKEAMAIAAISHGKRADGRGHNGDGCTTIRPLEIEAPALPECVHGSSLFTRGETQVICTVSVGPPQDGILLNDPFLPAAKNSEDETNTPFQDLPVGSLRYLKTQEHLESDLNTRKVKADREQTGDSGILKERRRAFLQYDFPPYSKGEVKEGPSGGGNRREIGHGALAEKAILPIIPPPEKFPYTIRMTSEVTSSNGSSSMASVCGATLALLDAGVPITAPVAGVSVGLAKIKEEDNDEYQLLLDITGNEDYFGSMDFKIAGTESEVTAFQLDVDAPLPISTISKALDLAKEARIEILNEMEKQAQTSSSGVITELLPRSDLKKSAPRVNIVRYDPARKKSLVGPGGAVIRQMEDRFNVSLDLTQEGQCLLFGADHEMVRQAKVAVMDLVADVEVGGVYEGTVIELRDFGAIIELLRNKEGLCHISELAEKDEMKGNTKGTLGLVHSLLEVGQRIEVECTAVDQVQGTIRLKPYKRL